ncbi:lysozyme [Pantoea piersonii]|jgi:lysozyme|uniref:lysozyme n=1 Tax=Pantoea piersonii TaxID=2364647 RepID=UPI000EA00584|nr:lysozyme [Pantoea piersonii]MBZ6386785.1 lysozyme [Pantoea piersonii]MBZ6400066.1 lysozyme [Pantoea piersonii]MBZ6409120.1 lysozyme [Pantoea piersonii]MBZ6426117.1 lysozyme [Pantoea piersonii]NYB04658.1 lysozyme [Pantoea piersonii]
MAVPVALRKRLVVAAGAGAFAIATMLLSGPDGLEGRVYVPYPDMAGVLTVCDGHTGTDIVRNKTYTDLECDRLMQADLKRVQESVDGLVKVPLGEYQRAALYSFAYNVGPEAFSRSTLLKRLNAGDREGACEELRRWIYAGGIKRKGLLNRRDMERSLCLAESADDI